MDDLLREFLTETNESLGVVDVELVRFEQEPNNASILANIFRLVHTIKGTCGFLGLPRLEALTHAAENLMGKFREGMPVTGEAVTLILFTIDRIKEILDELEKNHQEPMGTDDDLIAELHGMLRQAKSPAAPPPGTVGSLVSQTAGTPAAPRRSFPGRTGARLPRNSGAGADASEASRFRQIRIGGKEAQGRRQWLGIPARQPIDPGECRYA